MFHPSDLAGLFLQHSFPGGSADSAPLGGERHHAGYCKQYAPAAPGTGTFAGAGDVVFLRHAAGERFGRRRPRTCDGRLTRFRCHRIRGNRCGSGIQTAITSPSALGASGAGREGIAPVLIRSGPNFAQRGISLSANFAPAGTEARWPVMMCRKRPAADSVQT